MAATVLAFVCAPRTTVIRTFTLSVRRCLSSLRPLRVSFARTRVLRPAWTEKLAPPSLTVRRCGVAPRLAAILVVTLTLTRQAVPAPPHATLVLSANLPDFATLAVPADRPPTIDDPDVVGRAPAGAPGPALPVGAPGRTA